MNKIINLILLMIFFSSKSYASSSSNLTIFSEPNMTFALAEITRNYAKEENIAISIDFSSSYELIENIDLGEPVDIFISSHMDWVKNLSQKGVVDRYNSPNFAEDKLVLITSKNNKKINQKEISKISDINEILNLISNSKISLIIGSDFTSLGRYTKKVLEDNASSSNANILSKFQIFEKQDEDKKSIIDFVNEQNDYCAIVMKSEIKNNKELIILSEIPYIDIDYRSLVIAGDNMGNARKFVEYLKTKKVQEILAKNGFII